MATKAEEINLAIPSKGSLYDGTLEFLQRAGLPVKYGNQRQYTARLGGIEGFTVFFQRAEEIPAKVRSGAVDLGVTGEDLFREQAVGSEKLLLVMRDLGYGHARLVVAVPNTWIDVTTMEELAELAFSFRIKQQRTLRIATKFPNLARRFLSEHGVVDYTLVESLGATESAPASGVADLIIDLTSSGQTLAENHLKTLKDGTVVASQACLMGSKSIASWNAERLERLAAFLDRIESYLRGKETYSIQATVQKAKLTELVRFAPTWRVIYSLPVAETARVTVNESFVEIRITCPRTSLDQAIRRLRESGADEVIVTQPAYVFRGHSETFHQLKRLLKKGSFDATQPEA